MRTNPATPPRRTAPPKYAKPAQDYPPGTGRSAGNDPTSKSRAGWEQFQEYYPGTPRDNSTRTPRRPGFVPAAPGGEEPQARSAYFNVSRGERPQASRARTHFVPPPPGQAPTAKKPDPLRPFRSRDDLTSNSERISTPYATAGGEKTYFSSTGLGRSASSRTSKNRDEWDDNDPSNTGSPHSHSSAGRHHSASPKMSSPKAHRAYSTSSSSSDEVEFSAKAPNHHERKPSDSRFPGHRQPQSKPFVNVEDEVDQDLRPNFANVNLKNSWANQARQGGVTDHTFSRKGSADLSEGLTPHRTTRETERKHHHSAAQPPMSAPFNSSPHSRASSQPHLERSRSWQEKRDGTDVGCAPKDFVRPTTGDQKEPLSMYGSSGHSSSPSSSSSEKWSDQWPFMSPKKPRISSALPPYWAVPSSMAPKRQAEAQKIPIESFSWNRKSSSTLFSEANTDSPHSFGYPIGHKTFHNKSNLKSHSSETINTNFSPEWKGEFIGSNKDYFVPPPPKGGNYTSANPSPTTDQGDLQQPKNESPLTGGQKRQNGFPEVPPANQPPPNQAKFSADLWSSGTWAFPPPPPPPLPGRVTNLKRPKTPRKPSRGISKRAAMTKSASVSAAVDDEGEDNIHNASGSAAESLSSQTTGDSSPMDIDAPSSSQQSQIKGQHKSSAQSDISETTPRPPGPPIPPRSNGHPHSGSDAAGIDLGNFKNVAPFASSNEGLTDLKELHTALPFESRPSTSPNKPLLPQRLTLPNPPKAPLIPETITQSFWERYIAQMRVYMFEWNQYNTKMLNHFNGRQAGLEKTLESEWMSSVGAGTEKGGYNKYMQGVEEDFRVRQHWDISWEKHRVCMKGLGHVREKVLGSSIEV